MLNCPNAYDELFGTIFTPEDRKKFENYIGYMAIDLPAELPKYMILCGGPKTGKTTALTILSMYLFPTRFDFGIYGDNIRQSYIIMHDVPIEKTIQKIESLERLIGTKIIMATNEHNFQVPEDCYYITMTGKTLPYNKFTRAMDAAKYSAQPYIWYCIDNLKI